MGGTGEAAARIPSAFSGLGLVLLTWLCARRWYSDDVGFVAGLIAATNYGYFSMARMALPDLPLACFVVAGRLDRDSSRYGRAGLARRPRPAGGCSPPPSPLALAC